jgi:hypothetical protein
VPETAAAVPCGGGKAVGELQVRRRVQEGGLHRSAVPASPAGFLQVGFRGVGNIEVDDAADSDCIMFFPTIFLRIYELSL